MLFSSRRNHTFTVVVVLVGMVVIPCASLVPRVVSARSSRPVAGQQKAHRQGEVLIRFKEGTSDSDKGNAAAAHRVRRRHQLRGLSGVEKFELSGNDDAQSVAAQLTNDPNVEFAEPNFLVTKDQASTTLPNDPRFGEEWAINNTGQNGGQAGSDIGAMEAWAKTTGGASTTIAIIDSGIDFTHPDLINNQWTNPNPTNGDVHGWDYITDSENIRDEAGHGTAIAGIIAAQGNNGTGISGVMWQAKLMSLRVLDSSGTGDIADAVEAIDYGVSHGAQVINISWGTPAESKALKDALQRAVRRGVVIVCSAGNAGQDVSSTPYYPASYSIPGVVSVAASDNADQLASWSNWSGQDITLAAPGVNILTTQTGNSYARVSGTSAAAPFVSGVVGLVKTLNPTLDSRTIARALSMGARKVASLSGKVASAGVVNAPGTVAELRNAMPVASSAPTPPYDNNANRTTDNSPLPPEVRNPNDPRRANGKDGKHDTAPAPKSAAPLDHLPDLVKSRKIRTSPKPSSPTAPIHANLICADCDPTGGGGVPNTNDPYFGTERNRPENRTGQSGVSLASRNFNWGLPIVSLPGRAGMDLNISLYYNSLVWTKQSTARGTAIQYNADQGTPAPGFQIGLPRLQVQYWDYDRNADAYIMITPSGGRTQMTRLPSPNSDIFESTDGTYTQLTYYTMPIVRTSDGTQYIFGTLIGSEWRCTQIEDRNGNYITASYDGYGHVRTITDTLYRTIYFDYNDDQNLQDIRQTWNGGVTHYWATFEYAEVPMNVSFSGLNPYGAPNGNQTVLSAVDLGTSSSYLASYQFDYNSYGQVYQIRHNAADGHQLEHTFYNINTSVGQTDCPKVSDRRDYAQDWNSGNEAITYYYVTNGVGWTQPETGAPQTGTLVQVQTPDNTVYSEYSHASGWDAGMPRLAEWWVGINRKKWVGTNWTQDNTSSPVPINPRVIETNIYDDNGNHSRTTIEYNAGYNLPTAVNEYSSGGALLRRTENGYLLWQDYIDRRIIGLPYQKDVWDSQTGALTSRVTYHFDWTGSDFFEDTPAAATQHDRTTISPTNPADRGNLSDIIQFDVINDPNNDNHTAHETKFRYNSTGSLLMKRDASWHANYFDYADNFTDGNRSTFAYPTTFTDGDQITRNAQYRYDFGAVTLTHSPTRTNGGTINYLDMTRDYDAYGRLEWIRNVTNQAYTHYMYDPNENYVHSYSTIIDTSHEFHSWQVMDGAGRVRASASDHPGSSDGHFMGSYVIYDNMGRVSEESNATEFSTTPPSGPAAWTAAGDDSVWRTKQMSYDWKGRLTQITNTDNTTQTIDYFGCGCAGGEVSTVHDEHGRQKRYTKDSLGRLATVDEFNWVGSVYATTNYTYNALDELTQINQAGQVRKFDYDGYGRLWHRITPEQGTTTYTYNPDDTVNVLSDGRGATTTYGYDGRHHVTSLSYSAAGGAISTATAYFQYDAAGNRIWMQDGQGYGSYAYNELGQMTSESRYFFSLGSWFTLSYGGYNLSGELQSVTSQANGQTTSYGYDAAGRLLSVSNSGYTGVTNYENNIKYRAFGAVRSADYGDGTSLSTAYDGRMRPITWDVSNVLGYNYNYDYFNERTGRVSYAGSLHDSALDRSYEYDQVGRLVISHSGAEARAAVGTGQWGTMDGPYSQGYVYDQLGNMTERYGWGGEVQNTTTGQTTYLNYSYQTTADPNNPNNGQINNRRAGFGYDDAGNVTWDGGQTFQYDVTGQQTRASYGGYYLDQSYDGDGLRVKKDDNGTVTYYLRSTLLGGQVVSELNNAGGWVRGYVYQGGTLLAMQQSGGTYWVHEDPVTKSKRVTDASNNIYSAVEQDPWGADAGTPFSGNQYFQPHRYTTYERDGNQSDEAMFRRYNRWHSRFDQPDPYDGSYNKNDPQSFNRYAYVQNDPTSFVDPTGLEPPICMLDSSPIDCNTAGMFINAGAGVLGPLDTTRWNRNSGGPDVGGFDTFRAVGPYAGWFDMHGILITVNSWVNGEYAGSSHPVFLPFGREFGGNPLIGSLDQWPPGWPPVDETFGWGKGPSKPAVPELRNPTLDNAKARVGARPNNIDDLNQVKPAKFGRKGAVDTFGKVLDFFFKPWYGDILPPVIWTPEIECAVTNICARRKM